MSEDKLKLIAKDGYMLVEAECYSGGRSDEHPSKVKLGKRWYPVIVREYKRVLKAHKTTYEDWFLCYAILNEETLDGFHFELLKDQFGRFWAKR